MKIFRFKPFWLMFFPSFLYAQVSWVPIGADCWALGGQSLTQSSVFGVQNNPAAITKIEKLNIGLYQELRFRQTALMLSAISLVQPIKWIHIGLGIVQQGNSGFNQQKINLSLAKKLGPQLALGINLTYVATHIAETDSKSNYLAEIGLLYVPNSKTDIGFFVFNPTQVNYQFAISEPFASFIRMGVSYKLSTQLKVLGEFEHRIIYGNSLKLGFEYSPVPKFFLAAGWSQNPQYITFGSGFQTKKYKINLAFSKHAVLGFTPHVSLVLNQFNSGKK